MTQLIDEKLAAERLGVSVRSLQKWRLSGSPVRFCRVGRRVLYRAADIEEFIESRLVRSTTEADAIEREERQ